MIIKFSPDMGMDEAKIPDELWPYITSLGNGNGEFAINLKPGLESALVNSLVVSICNHWSSSNVGALATVAIDNGVSIGLARGASGQTLHQPPPLPSPHDVVQYPVQQPTQAIQPYSPPTQPGPGIVQAPQPVAAVVECNDADEQYGIVTQDQIPVILGSQTDGTTMDAAKQLKDSMEELANAENKVLELTRRITVLGGTVNGSSIVVDLISKMSALREHAKVTDVSITTENCIAIKTTDLITENEYEGAKRRIGVLSIHIPINILARSEGNYGNIRIMNHTHVFEECQAPHVNGHDVCVGNGRTTIRDAIINVDLMTVVDTFISLVTRPDENDPWGRSVNLFPRVGE